MANIDDNGFWLNKKGERTHPKLIRVDEVLKDNLVDGLIDEAKTLSEKLKDFKESSASEISSFFELLMSEYGLDKNKSKKGNITLENYSATAKVQVSNADSISYTTPEKLNNISRILIPKMVK